MTNPNNLPTTDDEWTIHSINIHGYFFEKFCENVIANKPIWKVLQTNLPVAHNQTASNSRPRESKLDILAEYWVDTSKIKLLVECKKNNPEFVDWIFFPNKKREQSIVYAEEARETRGSYQTNTDKKDRTKTSNTAVTEAAEQVALAEKSVRTDDFYNFHSVAEYDNKAEYYYNSELYGDSLPLPTINYIPVVVTTANLRVCDFNFQDIDPKTGEIPVNKTTLINVPYLLFEFAIPRYLQPELGISEDRAKYVKMNIYEDTFMRLPVYVVNSQHFDEFLTKLPGWVLG